MSDLTSFLPTLLMQLPSIIFQLVIAILCINFLLQKNRIEILLILIGSIFHFITSFTWMLFMFNMQMGDSAHSDWMWLTTLQGVINLLGTISFSTGVIVLIIRHLNNEKRASATENKGPVF